MRTLREREGEPDLGRAGAVRRGDGLDLRGGRVVGRTPPSRPRPAMAKNGTNATPSAPHSRRNSCASGFAPAE